MRHLLQILNGKLESWAAQTGPAGSGAEFYRRYLVLGYGVVLAGQCVLASALFFALSAHVLASMCVLVFVVAFYATRLVHRGGSTRTGSFAMLTSVSLAFAFLLVGGDGTSSPLTEALIILPMSAGLLSGFAGAVRWGLVAVVMVITIGSCELLGVLPEPFVLVGLDTAPVRGAVVALILVLMIGVALVQNHMHTRSRQEADSARIEAEKADEIKSSFLLNISHELLTPLNGVLGLGEVLIEMDIQDEQRELLRGVTQSGTRLQRLIEDLLDFSEIQAAVASAQSERFKIHELIENVVEQHRAVAETKEIHLSASVGEAPPTLHGDGKRLARCLAILVDNAIKFTHEGSVEIAFEWDGSHGRWTVKDSGIGISAEERPHIFDSFRQVAVGSTRPAGGLGLGLAHMVSLVELLDGSFGFSSVEGEGSSFWFEVPLQAKYFDLTSSMVVPVPRGSARFARPPRILVAEDDQINRTTVEMLLCKLGCEVETVVHGRRALEALQRGRTFDLVLMDCEMPVMDGYETTRRIRQRLSKAQLPVVALTGHALAANRTRCLGVGMNDYLTKPVSRAQLCRIIETWVRIEEFEACA